MSELQAMVREAVREELGNHTTTGVEQLVRCGHMPRRWKASILAESSSLDALCGAHHLVPVHPGHAPIARVGVHGVLGSGRHPGFFR
jgi:hypothetical protein